MAKPIFIIRTHLMNNGEFSKTYRGFEKQLGNEYHVICIADENVDEWKFQMFSDKEIEPIELERLKEIINRPPAQ